MKKKLLSLFMALVLVCSNCMVTFAAESLEEPKYIETENVIKSKDAAETLAAISDSNSVVVDIRAAEDYKQAHIKGSVSNPVCKADFSVTTDERDAFLAFAESNNFAGKDIYLVCYVGTFCVNHAAKWLIDAGYSANDIYRVTGGVWQNTTLSAACNSTHYDVALADPNGVILDVRSTNTYDAGYVDKSLNAPLFKNGGGVSNGTDELAQAFTAFVQAHKSYLEGKNIYLLCNGGAVGAALATKLLAAEGFKTTASNEGCDVFTIEGGANSSGIKPAGLLKTNQTVELTTAADVEAALADDDIVILDVRADEKYQAGTLPGSVHNPVFWNAASGKNGASNGYDDMAKSFLAYVKDNASKFNGKDIYVLCNSGASGAKAATKLLMQAGYSTENIYTIKDGAGGAAVSAALKKPPVAVSEYKFISSADALKSDANTIIIDVRSNATQAKDGTLADSVSLPLFDNGNKLDTADAKALADAFTKYVTDNKATLGTKQIYILCNSGSRGAQKATQLLSDAGYNVATTEEGQVYTIKGGATNLDIRYSCIPAEDKHTVSGDEAVAVVDNKDYVIIDVRANGDYAAGHLKGSTSLPVFGDAGVVTTTKDDLSTAFTKYVTDNKADLEAKKGIYILCNSGSRGAQAATVLLRDAGHNLDNVFTIKGGYKDPNNLEDNHVKENATYVSGSRVITALKNQEKDVVIIDVRSSKTQEETGTLKGSLSLPLFDANNEIDSSKSADTKALEEAFVKYVEEHRKELEGKKIYILCNSGKRGAQKATELLTAAKLEGTSIFTIENGAKDPLIAEALKLSLNAGSGNGNGNGSGNGTVKTGDTANVMSYALVMAISLLAIAFVSKRKFSK